MKLLWLSPTHSRSAIARFSELVIRQLVEKGCHIDIASTEPSFDQSERRSFLDLSISSFADLKKQGLDDTFDAIIANFGDHYPNHALSLDALPFSRVIGIFHDADMINFGNGVRAAGRELSGLSEGLLDGKQVTAAIAKICGGAVAHSDFYRAVVAQCDGPIDVIALAWSLPQGIERRKILSASQKSSNEKFRLVTFGNINQNKCVDRVIEAIAASPELREASEYRLVGAIEEDERKRLSEMSEKLRVRIVVAGSVDDTQLHRELNDADVVSCLRDPVLEGASASAIEAMLHGCAVLVSDAGFYASLSDDCVVKVPAATNVEAIQGALEQLFANPAQRIAMGQRAREYSEIEFSPDRYADNLLRLINDVRVTSAYNSTINSVAGQLSGLGLQPKNTSVELVLRGLEAMAPVVRRATNTDKHQELFETSTPMAETAQ